MNCNMWKLKTFSTNTAIAACKNLLFFADIEFLHFIKGRKSGRHPYAERNWLRMPEIRNHRFCDSSFSSNNSKVASVNTYGKITAKKAGTARITAKIKNGEASCTVRVAATKIQLSARSISLENGYCAKLSATAGGFYSQTELAVPIEGDRAFAKIKLWFFHSDNAAFRCSICGS